MHYLSDKNIGVLLDRPGDDTLARVVQMILEPYESVAEVRGFTLQHLETGLRHPDIVLTLDSVRGDNNIEIHTERIVTLVREKTHKAMPVVIYVSPKRRTNASPIEPIGDMKNAFMFSFSEHMPLALRMALDLPQ